MTSFLWYCLNTFGYGRLPGDNSRSWNVQFKFGGYKSNQCGHCYIKNDQVITKCKKCIQDNNICITCANSKCLIM